MDTVNFYNVFYSCFLLMLPLLVAALLGGIIAALFRLLTKLDDEVISFSFRLSAVMFGILISWKFYANHLNELAMVYWSRNVFF